MKEKVLLWWFAEAPASRLGLLRILVGGFAMAYLAYYFRNYTSVVDFAPGQFDPVGVASLLGAPLPGWLLLASFGLSLALGLAFTLGAAFAITGPAFALLLLGLTSYRNSWGMVFHTENLLTLHVLLLAAGPAADALSWDARALRGREPARAEPSDARYGWPLRAMSLVTVICYVLAGVAKLKLSGGGWFGGEMLRAQIAYDNLRKLELGAEVSPLGPWLVRHRSAFPPLALMTLLVELGAPLALLRRRFAVAWVFAAWSFHVGVLLLMSISFLYQLSGAAYLSLFPIERWLLRFERGAAR